MSHIYIYSPSSAVRDKVAFRRGVRHLQALGHDVEIDEAALSSHMRFAGDDDTRVAAVVRAAASGADVALISRGGYGLTRILPALPYRQLAKAVERGTRFVGLSDFTALQCALLARTGAVSWAGPALGEDFGAEEPDDIMQACFDDLLCGQGEGSGWRLPTRDAGWLPVDRQTGLPHMQVNKTMLWGGNLSVLGSLVGTPYLPPVKGGVLFLEDVNEQPYRVERMLLQLHQAGVLAAQKAVLLGDFTVQSKSPLDRGYSLRVAVEQLRSVCKTPILSGLPFGHVPTKVTLPVGAPVQLAVQGREVFVGW